MKKFLKHIGLLLFVVFGIASLLSIGCLWALRNSDFYKPSFLVNGVSENQFNYIILGSSVGLTTLDTKLVDSINNTRGLNLSMDDTGISSQYLMLEHFLAEGKSTDYVILAPGIAALQNTEAGFGDNDYRFLMYSNREYVSDYYKNAFAGSPAAKVSYLTKWLPFVGVSYYNTELFFPSIYTLIAPKKHNRFDENGNYTYPKRTMKFSNRKVKKETVSFDHPYLKKILSLCEANHIKLIYYFAPLRTERIEYASPNFPVIDQSEVLTDDASFYDDIHVNYKGREKVSGMFAKSFLSIIKKE